MKGKAGKVLSIVLLSVFFLPSMASAATYYVDSLDGSDSNDGTSTTTAWRSATPINARTFVAGDSVLFRRGLTFSNMKVMLFDESGTSGNPIIFDAYGTGVDPILDAGTQNRLFDLRNSASYITIRNLTLQNPSESGIFLFTGTFTGLDFDHLSITGTTSQAISVNSNATTTGSQFRNISTSGFAIGSNVAGKSIGDTYRAISGTARTRGLQFGSASIPTQNLTLDDISITAGTAECIRISMLTGLVATDITAQGCGTNGIYFLNGSTDISIANSLFSGNGERGIRFDSKATSTTIATTTVSNNNLEGILFVNGANDSFFSNLTVESNGDNGFETTLDAGDTLDITHSSFDENGTAMSSNGLAINGAGGTVTISHTSADYNSNDGFNIHNAPVVNIDTSSAIGNGIDGSGSDGDGFSWHETSSGLLSNSYAWNNKKSAITNVNSSSVILHSNIFGHDATPGTNALVTLFDSATMPLYNNTLVSLSQTGTGIGFFSTTTNTAVNNIVYGFDVGISKSVNATLTTEDHNLVFGAATSNFSGLVQGAHSISADPKFTNVSDLNFRLQGSSPAINAGTSTPYATDYIGNSQYGVARDMGAYEYQADPDPEPVAEEEDEPESRSGQSAVRVVSPNADSVVNAGGTPSVTSLILANRSLFLAAQAQGIVLPAFIRIALGLPSSYTRDLTLGTEGEDVRALQAMLISKGYAISAGATGYFGEQTRAALAAYQAANGISPAAGYFGAKTRALVD